MRWRLLSNSTQLTTSIVASSQVHGRREHLYLELEQGGILGYGEISPQPTALNGDAGIDEIIQEWEGELSASLESICHREQKFPPWYMASRISGPRSSAKFASALLEMALLDLELKQSARSLEGLWATNFETPRQFTVSGLSPDEWQVPKDVQRLRVKVGPKAIEPQQVARIQEAGLPIILDYNCSAPSLRHVVDEIRRVGNVVDSVEQPFAPGNLVDHALLAREIDCRVSLDEGIRSLADLQLASRHQAASLICIKPARMGGFANAKVISEKATDLGIASYIGGYFESPLARMVNAMFAMHLTNEASDISMVDLDAVNGTEFESSEFGHGLVPSHEFLNRCRVVATSTLCL